MCFGKGSDDVPRPDFVNRRCRDVLCLILFAVFMIGMIVLAIFAGVNGNYRRIANGIDLNGCTCGLNMLYNATSDTCSESSIGPQLGRLSTFVMLFDSSTYGREPVIVCANACAPADGPLIVPICVLDNDASAMLNCKPTDGDCMVSALRALPNPPSACAGGDVACAKYVAKNCGVTPAANPTFGYCVPNAVNATFSNAAGSVMQSSAFSGAFNSIASGALIILAAVFVALAAAFAWTKLLQYCAKVITVSCILLIQVAFIVSGVFLLEHAQRFQNVDPNYKNNASWQLNYYGAIAILVCGGVYFIIVLIMWKRIMLAVQCLKVAGKAIRDTPTLIALPLVLFVVTCGIGAVWLLVTVDIFSCGTIEKGTLGVGKHIVLNKNLQYAFLYHLFGLFWSTQFLVAFSELTIAIVICRWYFAETVDGKRQLPQNPVRSAVHMVFKYHLGSVAFGSLIIAVIKFIRACIEFLREHIEKHNNNRLVKIIFCIVQCCMWCVESCMKFINRQAYIQIALTGEGFCSAARRAFGLLFRNAGRVAALRAVATLHLALLRLAVMMITVLFTFAVLTKVPAYADHTQPTAVQNPFVVCVIVAVLAYTIGSLFTSIYSTAIDAVLMSFIHEEESPLEGGKRGDAELAGHIETLNADFHAQGVGVKPVESVSIVSPIVLASEAEGGKV